MQKIKHYSIMDPEFIYLYEYQKEFGIREGIETGLAKAYNAARDLSIKASHKAYAPEGVSFEDYRDRVNRVGRAQTARAAENPQLSMVDKAVLMTYDKPENNLRKGGKALLSLVDPGPLMETGKQIIRRPGTVLKKILRRPMNAGLLADQYGFYGGALAVQHGNPELGYTLMTPGTGIGAGMGLQKAYEYIPGLKTLGKKAGDVLEKPLNYVSDKVSGLIHRIKRKK